MPFRSIRRFAGDLALTWIMLLVCAAMTSAEAQIWKKAKEKAKAIVGNEAVAKTEELLRNAIRCAFNDDACIAKAKAANKPVVLTDNKGKVLTDEKGEPITDQAQLPPEQQAQLASKASPAQPLNVPKITLPPIDKSWLADPSVKRWKDSFLIYKDLWSVEKDAMVAAQHWYDFGPRVVAGRPDLLASNGVRPPAWGFAAEMAHVGRAGSPATSPQMEMCIPPAACEQRGIQSRVRQHGPYLSNDFRRVLYFEKGDLWRADMDWLGGKFANRKQVTQVGLLQEVTLLHWYRNTVFMQGNLSREKPIIRVDLRTGAVEELPYMGVFPPLFASPAGHWLCARAEKTLKCYDVRSGKVSDVAVPVDMAETGLFRPVRAVSPDDDARGVVWPDGDVMISHYSGTMGQLTFVDGKQVQKPPTPAGLLRVDLRTGRADILFAGRTAGDRMTESIGRIELLPGRRHIAVDLVPPNLPGQTAVQRKVRVAVEDGAVVDVPDVPLEGVWLDDEKYFYSHLTGGISQIGTWIHDLKSGSKRKVCHVAGNAGPVMPQTGEPPVLYYPEHNALYFMAGGNGMRVFKSDLTTGKCRDIKTGNSAHEIMLSRLRTPPLDLRLGVSGDALW